MVYKTRRVEMPLGLVQSLSITLYSPAENTRATVLPFQQENDPLKCFTYFQAIKEYFHRHVFFLSHNSVGFQEVALLSLSLEFVTIKYCN